mmetsp:Transcript_61862/g.75841  ORF Transcript_61862/g.75841 Transcript_61862/m.75841 type:complete len:414 (+) Transcript_61862:81-1322(+)
MSIKPGGNDDTYQLLVTNEDNKKVITKYDPCGSLILFLSGMFVVFLPVWIIVNAIIGTIQYQACAVSLSFEITCVDSYWPAIFQLGMFPLHGYFLYSLYKTLKTSGIVVYEPKQEHSKCGWFYKLLDIKDKAQHLIDCRECAHKKYDDPLKQTIEFVYRSLVVLALFDVIASLPLAIFNLLSGDNLLQVIAYSVLVLNVYKVLVALYGYYCCCCNPCRGYCCSCCQCFFDECFCGSCCLRHFPEHHRKLVFALDIMVKNALFASYASSIVKILALADLSFIGSPSQVNQYHIILKSANYLLGYYGLIGVLKLFWKYYYILCAYWVRNDINQIENKYMHSIISDWLMGAYVFFIKIDDADQFARVNDEEPTAKQIHHPCTCYSCCIYCNMIGFGAAIIFFMIIVTDSIFSVDLL